MIIIEGPLIPGHLKIEKPTTAELKEYFVNNRKYFDQLAAYYSVLDPEFYDTEFSGIEERIKNKKSFIRKKTFCFFSLLIILLLMYYIMPFGFQIDGKEYVTGKNSFSVETSVIPDFQDGMNFYREQRYENAIDVFQKINEDNSKYSEALRMIGVCRKKMEQPEKSNKVSP